MWDWIRKGQFSTGEEDVIVTIGLEDVVMCVIATSP